MTSSGPPRDLTAEARSLLQGCCVAGAGRGCEVTCQHGETQEASPWIDDPGPIARVGPMSASVEQRLRKITEASPTDGNEVRILSDGADSFGAMLELVRAARMDIRFENFIFRSDTVGRAFARELRLRAEDGLRVRVLHDPAGALMARRPPVDLLFRGSTVEVGLFNLGFPTKRRRSLGRDHRKLVVVDEEQMIAGGICLADAWAGNCIRHCTWRDSAIHVRGPAAQVARKAFDQAWAHAQGVKRRRPIEYGHVDGSDRVSHGGVGVRILASLGDHRPTLRVLERVIDAAEARILVTNPYLVPPAGIVRRLCEAARRGVEVTLLVPERNNHQLVGLSVEHGLGTLLEAGCRVFLWQGAMIHAKTVVVDNAWMLVGSTNLDRLSLRKNAELDVEVHGSGPAAEMTKLFLADCRASLPFTLVDWRRRSRLRRLGSRLAAQLRWWQ